jgi:Family of unknown function (DUF6232)
MAERGRLEMILYRGAELRITHEVFEVLHPTHRVYHVRLMHEIHVVKLTASPGALDSLRRGSTGAAVAAAVAVVAGWPSFDSPAASLVGLVLLGTASIVAGACWRLRPSSYELWATYRTEEIVLFQTTDAQVFGQVKRALIRALESVADGQ